MGLIGVRTIESINPEVFTVPTLAGLISFSVMVRFALSVRTLTTIRQPQPVLPYLAVNGLTAHMKGCWGKVTDRRSASTKSIRHRLPHRARIDPAKALAGWHTL